MWQIDMAMMKRIFTDLCNLEGYDIDRPSDFKIMTHGLKKDYEDRGFKLVGEIQDYNRDNSDTMLVWEVNKKRAAVPKKVKETDMFSSTTVGVAKKAVKAIKSKLVKKPKTSKAKAKK